MKTNLKSFQLTEDEINVLEDMLFCVNSKEELIKNFQTRNSIWVKCLRQETFEAELRELQKKAELLGYDNDSLILLDKILGYDRTGENLARMRNK